MIPIFETNVGIFYFAIARDQDGKLYVSHTKNYYNPIIPNFQSAEQIKLGLTELGVPDNIITEYIKQAIN